MCNSGTWSVIVSEHLHRICSLLLAGLPVCVGGCLKEGGGGRGGGLAKVHRVQLRERAHAHTSAY